jgi:deazaflavin-dependent oxidoreductase (nitroreductase family)
MLLKLMMSPGGMKLDRFLVRWAGYSPLSVLFAKANNYPNPRQPMLLVAKGRKSGRKRATVLPWFEIDGRFLVVGSNGGAATEPQWVSNLRADPNATLYVARKPRTVKARFATGEERTALWDKLVVTVPIYAQYQTMTTREIPLVILEPA